MTGRMTDVSAGRAKVELGEGVNATCRLTAEAPREEDKQTESKVNLSSMTSMLEAKWRRGQGGGDAKAEPVRSGQIRSFRIIRLDPNAKKIELELA